MASNPEDYTPDWMDVDAAKKNAGIFTNRIFAQHLGEGMLRMNFGEMADPDDPQYHTALVISATNAVAFAELIYRMGQEALAPVKINVTTAPQTDESNVQQ